MSLHNDREVDETQHLREMVVTQTAMIEVQKIKIRNLCENFNSLLDTIRERYPDDVVVIMHAISVQKTLREFEEPNANN